MTAEGEGAKALPSCPFCGKPPYPMMAHSVYVWPACECFDDDARFTPEGWRTRTPDPATVRVLEAAKRVIDAVSDRELGATIVELRGAVEALAGREAGK